MASFATFSTLSLDILKGPGATKLLDTSLILSEMELYTGSGPKLKFTVSEPETGTPTFVLLEFIQNFQKDDGYYCSKAIKRAKGGYFRFVWLKYRFDDPDGNGRGTITAV